MGEAQLRAVGGLVAGMAEAFRFPGVTGPQAFLVAGFRVFEVEDRTTTKQPESLLHGIVGKRA